MNSVTMQDVAREAGVSRALVSIAYRGVAGVSDATRERIFAVGARLGYVHNQIAARLAGKSLNTIGVFLQDLHNEVFADEYDGIRSITGSRGIHLVLAVGDIDGSLDAEGLGALHSSRVDAIIVTGLQLSDKECRPLTSRTPVISIARAVPGADVVRSDDALGATLATRHLLELGHRRILFLSNPQTDGYRDRQRGFRETMADANAQPWVIETTYARAQAARDAGDALDSATPPTAIFAHNDLTALGVLDALATRGLVAGRDVSVVGYDNTTASQAPGSALTTVDLHSVELGRRAAELALKRMAEPTSPLATVDVTPTLVVRGSTGKVRTRR